VNEKAEMPPPKMDAPTGLDLNPRPPRSVRVSKRAAGTLMAIAAVILGLFAYGGYKRQQRQVATLAEGSMPHNVAPATAAGVEIAKDLPSGNAQINPQQRAGADPGLLQPPGDMQLQAGQLPAGGQVFVRQTPIPAQPVVAQIPQPREPSPEERRLLAAYEREQQAIAAPTTLREGFGSPMLGTGPQSVAGGRGTGDDASQIASVVQALTRQNGTSQVTPEAVRALVAQRSQSAEGDGDPESNGQNAKELFLAKARAGQTEDYIKSTRTAPLSRYEIKAGWEIPAVLEQALNSDLPGELKALVSSNVYDTASGRYLLIPQGARLVGVYNSRIGYGQDGVQVIWDRVIYPDSSSLDLSGMIGQDAHGFSGFRDKVDRHYTRLIGFAVLTSLFAAASEISQNQNRSLLTYPSPAQVAGSAVGQQASDLGAQITRRNLNVQPTIKIAVGYRFNVRVNRDILFDAPYTPVSTNR
jgi:type IV secretory pathway VirB10-like protein